MIGCFGQIDMRTQPGQMTHDRNFRLNTDLKANFMLLISSRCPAVKNSNTEFFMNILYFIYSLRFYL